MKEVSFRQLSKSASPTHKPAAGYLANLMDKTGITLLEASRMSPEELENELEGMRLKKPDMWARKIRRAINHIAEKNPTKNLPTCEITPSHHHILPPVREQPVQFRLDMVAAWRGWKAERKDINQDLAPPIEAASFYQGVRQCRTFIEVLKRAVSKPIGPNFGIEAMTHPKLAEMTLKRMKAERYSEKTISSVAYQVIAFLRRLHTDGHDHLKWLVPWVATAYPTKEISVEQVAVIRLLLAQGGLSLLNAAPRRIAGEAHKPHLGPKDRVARLSYALLLSLKIDHPGLEEGAGAQLNLDQDIGKTEKGYFLRLRNAGLKGEDRFESMTDQTIQLVEDVKSEKNASGYCNPLLFPIREEMRLAKIMKDGKEHPPSFRQTSSVTNGLYSEIEHVTGLRTTFAGIKDLFVTTWLDAGVSSLIAAQRAGYRHERSLRLRHAYFFVSKPSIAGSERQP